MRIKFWLFETKEKQIEWFIINISRWLETGRFILLKMMLPLKTVYISKQLLAFARVPGLPFNRTELLDAPLKL